MHLLFFQLIRQPIYQLVFFLLITLLLIPFLGEKNANATWNTAGIIYIVFIITNALFIWFTDNTWAYFFTSLGYTLLYLLAAGLIVSSLISILKIKGSGESGMIFLFIIYHPVVLLLVIFVKWIIASI